MPVPISAAVRPPTSPVERASMISRYSPGYDGGVAAEIDTSAFDDDIPIGMPEYDAAYALIKARGLQHSAADEIDAALASDASLSASERDLLARMGYPTAKPHAA
jgi:hypothetical protein